MARRGAVALPSTRGFATGTTSMALNWWRASSLLLMAAAVSTVAAQDERNAEDADPTAAYKSYMGYLDNVVPMFGVALLIFVYFFAGGDPEKSIRGPKVRVSHILVQDEGDAEEIFQQAKNAKNKKTRFAELAAKRSTCPSKSKGGHMGVFGKGMMQPEFEAVAFTAPVGSIHKIHTKFGWHVLMIAARDENHDKSAKKAQ